MKNKYLVDIYKGLSNGDSIRTIHKQLLDDTLNQKKQHKAVSEQMLNVALASVNNLKKRMGSALYVSGYVKTTYGSQVDEITFPEMLSIFVFDLINKNKIEKKLSHEITVEADKNEAQLKEDAISETIEKNRKSENPKIFYLASKHNDCAEDHEDYQGKMYIDEKWRFLDLGDENKKRVSKYVYANNIRTVQWVMGKPVWLITRPNCRHYFQELTVDDVLGKSTKRLLRKYKMNTAIGDREYLQTIAHSTNGKWYANIRNAELLLEKYKQRLSLHQAMYQAKKNKIVYKAIGKDKMLIAKWNDYIAKHNV